MSDREVEGRKDRGKMVGMVMREERKDREMMRER